MGNQCCAIPDSEPSVEVLEARPAVAPSAPGPVVEVLEASPAGAPSAPGVHRSTTACRSKRLVAPQAGTVVASHPVASFASSDAIGYVRATSLPTVPTPWPRRQDAGPIFKSPASDDLVICVSHGWPYQVHPDPLGEKALVIEGILADVARVHQPAGETLCFFDFLSCTQRPRVDMEESHFQQALSAMPWVYLNADAVVHVDGEWSCMPEDGELLEVPARNLRDAELLQLPSRVQILTTFGQVRAHDLLDQVDGQRITSVKAARAAFAEGAVATLRRAPMGIRNSIAARDRGWVFLERFCSMVKFAMLPEVSASKVAFGDPDALAQIQEGGSQLRQAAQAGETALSSVLQRLVDELKTKQFSSTSTDKVVDDNKVDPSEYPGDYYIVAGLMQNLAAHLPTHWAAEQKRQRQRGLVMQIHNDNVETVRGLLADGADPNEPNELGQTPLHIAALRRNVVSCKALLIAKGDVSKQDDDGNCPFHKVALWADETTMELFDLLAMDSLDIENDAGVSVFDRFYIWADTASEGQPYGPAQERLRHISAPTKSYDTDLGASMQTLVETSAVEYSAAQHAVDPSILVHTWTAPGAKIDILFLFAMWLEPWEVAKEGIDILARKVCGAKCARLVALEPQAKRDATLPDFNVYVQGLVAGLPLGQFVLVDATMGACTSLIWELPQLRGCVIINHAGYWLEEFLGSDAHRGFCKVMDKYIGLAVEGDTDFFRRNTGAICFYGARHEMNTWTNKMWEQLRAEALRGNPRTLEHHSAQLEWQKRALAEVLYGRATNPLPVTLIASAFAPSSLVLDGMKRLSSLLPNHEFAYIPRSKASWASEGPGQLQVVIAEVCALLDRAQPNA